MKSTLKVVMSAMICGSLWIAPVALAVIETYEFSFAELEVRYHQLSQELRCPKCQNQNIADSNAPIARDLRVVLYEQLEQGATDDEILAFMVARYGEFVRYRPGVDRNTILLWAAPGLLLILGVAGLLFHLRQRPDPASDLTEEEQAEIARLLGDPRD